MKQLLLTALALATGLSAQNAGISLSNLVDGFVEVPYAPQLVPQSGITVEAWVTYDDATIGTSWRYPTIVRQNRNAGQESFFLRVQADNTNRKVIRWLVNAGTRVSVDWTFAPGQLTTWTHLAGTWDGRTARLFVNGAEVGSNPGSGALIDQGDVLRIGKGSDIGTPMEVWNGSIDEVRLWPFARSAAEITATMHQALSSMPGQVSTWNLDFSAVDSSAGRHATVGGAVAYTTAVTALTPETFPGLAVGNGTPGCNGAIEAATSSVPKRGNPGFAVVAQRFPAQASTVLLLGLAATSPPLPILGVDLWLDPAVLIGGFTPSLGALGAARLDLPIPAGLPSGATLAAQFVALDPCGPLGLTASNAIAFSLL
ncbi:MAG: LamG domain-containing protein [Planctomycetes bacterium]|nr:LamG domain-containing protein [Planctomycetota bacterium]